MFGWRPVPAEIHEYIVLEVPPDCPFGLAIIPAAADKAGGGLVLYFAVDDPAAIAARVTQAGGLMKFGPAKLFGYGEIWQVEDPAGVRWGLYRKASLPRRD